MCKLNELPNNEEKYNKILSYFNKKLGDIDDFPHTKHYSRGIGEITLYVFYHQYLKEYDETSNKILSYFNKKLGDIDDFPHTKHYSRGIGEITLYVFYHQYLKEYDETSLEGKLAINKMASEAPKEKYILDSNNIKSMYLAVAWQTNRYYLDGNEGSGFYWNEEKLQCIDVASKGVKNE